jgi:hypothetical protein
MQLHRADGPAYCAANVAASHASYTGGPSELHGGANSPSQVALKVSDTVHWRRAMLFAGALAGHQARW